MKKKVPAPSFSCERTGTLMMKLELVSDINY